jgi:hypothetical protein
MAAVRHALARDTYGAIESLACKNGRVGAWPTNGHLESLVAEPMMGTADVALLPQPSSSFSASRETPCPSSS